MDKALMKLMVNCPNSYREVLLTDSQIELFEVVKNVEPVTSRFIAMHFEISKQNASVQLRNLFLKKYLVRKNVRSESGGQEFEYSVAPFLNGEGEGE